MLKDLFSKWFSNSSANKPKAPKTFKQKNRSIFINRYAGLVYFLVAWHTFGYFIIKLAKDNANQRGLELHETLSEGTNLTKIEFNKNFEVKITTQEAKK